MAARLRFTCVVALVLLTASGPGRAEGALPGTAQATRMTTPAPCAGTAADGSIALSTRVECREQTMQTVRAAVQTFNAAAHAHGPRPRQRPRRAESAGIRTTPLHRLAPLPGRYYGQQ